MPTAPRPRLRAARTFPIAAASPWTSSRSDLDRSGMSCRTTDTPTPRRCCGRQSRWGCCSAGSSGESESAGATATALAASTISSSRYAGNRSAKASGVRLASRPFAPRGIPHRKDPAPRRGLAPCWGTGPGTPAHLTLRPAPAAARDQRAQFKRTRRLAADGVDRQKRVDRRRTARAQPPSKRSRISSNSALDRLSSSSGDLAVDIAGRSA